MKKDKLKKKKETLSERILRERTEAYQLGYEQGRQELQNEIKNLLNIRNPFGGIDL